MAKKRKTNIPVRPVHDQEEKLKALQAAIEKVKKDFGESSVMWMNEKGNLDIDVIPTGSLYLDMALGVGGYPRGRIIEIFGAEASGKTTLTLHAIAEAQKLGGIALFIDAEHAFDPVYAEQLGVDTDRMIISQPDFGEQALEIADHFVRSGTVDIIVIDSVAALVPRAELEGSMEDSSIGLQARMMSQALRKLTANISKSHTICFFINQLRASIGSFSYGDNMVTTGGNALKFYSSVRIKVNRGTKIMEGDEQIGNMIKFFVKKNKVAPPFKTAESFLIYGEGISRVLEILNLAEELGIIRKSGSWYSYGDQKLGQGLARVRELLKNSPELLSEIEQKVLEELYKQGRLRPPADWTQEENEE